MSKMRQDAWTHEDDLLLAETVLRHIREGSTQLNAFEEVGDKLNRTSAACGFRWNAEVRNQYNSAIDLAKRQRKERKRQEAKKQKEQTSQQVYSSVNRITLPTENKHSLIIEESLTLDDVIKFLSDLKKDYYYSNESKSTIENLRSENDQLHDEVEKLKKQLAMTDNKLKVVEADYNTFIQIMDRARKMTVLDDQSHLKAPTFKMDKNGNLEQYAQGSD